MIDKRARFFFFYRYYSFFYKCIIRIELHYQSNVKSGLFNLDLPPISGAQKKTETLIINSVAEKCNVYIHGEKKAERGNC